MADPFEIPPQRAEPAGDRDLMPVSGLDDLPPAPPRAPDEGKAAVRRSSAGDPGPPASSKEDIPFPLPPDWFERKAAEQAAKAAAEQARQEVAAAPPPAPEPAAPPAPTRTRPSAELLRAVAQRASGEHRLEGSNRHAQEGDALAAAGRWAAAAIEYEHAARKAATPGGAMPFAAKADAARARVRRRRMLGATLAALAVLGGLGAAAWRCGPQLLERLRPAPGDAAGATERPGAAGSPANASLQDRTTAITVLASLELDAQDEQKPWSAVAAAATAALAQPGIDRPRVQAVLDRAGPEAARQASDAAAIAAASRQDPAKALALAATFRLTHKRAGDHLAELPLPARVVVRGADDAAPTVTYDGVPLAGTGWSGAGVVFCRHAKAGRVVVEAPGYQRAEVEVPADTFATERVITVALRETPAWTLPAPAAAPPWMVLRALGGTLATIHPQAVQTWSLRDGRALATLDPHAVAGMPAGPCTWAAAPESNPAELWLSTSTGAVIGVGLEERGFTAARLLHLSGRAVSSLDFGKLVLQLDKPAVFSASLPPKAELAAEAEGRKLWSVPLTATLPPRVRAKGEFVVAIDDLRLRVLGQDSIVVRTVALPRPRTGAVQAFDGGRVLVVPTATGACVLRSGGDLAYAPVGEIAEARELATRGDLLVATTADHGLAAWRLDGDAFKPAWTLPLPDGSAATALGLGDKVACCAGAGGLHLVDLVQHALLRTILLDQEPLAPALVAGDLVVVADRLGQVSAYHLAKPGSAR